MDAKIFEWELTYDNAMEAVEAIGIVDEPAIEVDFKFASEKKFTVNEGNFAELLLFEALQEKQKESRTFEVPEERLSQLRRDKVILGPAMIPNDLILRSDEDGEPFWIFFSEKSVRSASQAFLKHQNTESFNLNHDSDAPATGSVLVETWIIEDPENDKSNYFGYNLPKGTWMISLKFDNPELYERYIVSGELKGFSVELGSVAERVIFNSELKLSTTVKSEPASGTGVTI